jgi:glycosyltransferase involved in cell wall biosynthesis
MRVLVVTDHYPPFIGGAQIQSQLLARELRERGQAVAVATVWQNALPALEHDDGIDIYRFRQLRTLPGLARPKRQHHQPPFPDPVTVFSLRRLIERFKPDVVHSHGWISYSCAAALIGMDIPLIIAARDYGYGCANRTLLRDGKPCSGPALAKCVGCAGRYYGRPKGWLAALGVLGSRPLLKRKVRGIHSISTHVRDMVRRDVLDERDTKNTSGYVIHDVIASVPKEPKPDADRSAVMAARLDELPPEPFILFIGALRPVKGLNQLLEAYRQLEDPPPLVLIGTIESDSPKSFPEGVHVLTDVPHDAVMSACERCLFGVMPSLWAEPFGTVVCEVMSRGRPVIGTTPGGHADMIVDGESGFLVPAGDVEALAEAMNILATDSELRERFGANALKRSRHFTAEVALPRIEQLYEELVARRRPAEATRGA